MISIANSIHNHECIPRIQRDTVLMEELSVVVYIGNTAIGGLGGGEVGVV